MEKTNREIRALLSSMAPARAAQAVRLVGLPPDEEAAVLHASRKSAFAYGPYFALTALALFMLRSV